MKRLWVLILTIPLCGCFADQKQQAAACEFEAMRTYHNDPVAPEVDYYTLQCMRAHGYDFTCQTWKGYAGNYYCYEPMDRIGRWISALEKRFMVKSSN